MKISPRLLSKVRQPPTSTLDFLLHSPDVNRLGSVLNNASASTATATGETGKVDRLGKIRGNTHAIYLMSKAVLKRDWQLSEQIFQSVPALSSRPAAIKWLLRAYCDSGDFTSARAMLFQLADVAGPSTACQFIARCALKSLNSSDIEEVYLKFRQYPEVLGVTLQALRILDDTATFNRVWEVARSQHGEPRRLPEVKQVGIYDMLVTKQWQRALEQCRMVLAETYDDPKKFRARQPYWWAARYFCRQADWQSLVAIFEGLEAAGLPLVNDQHSALIIELLSPKYPEIVPVKWLNMCKEQGWPVKSAAASKVLDELQRRFPFKRSTIDAARKKYGCLQPFHSDYDQDLHRIRQDPATALSVLDDMRKRGMIPSYYHCVEVFDKLARIDDRKGITELTQRLDQWGYPKHCAGIDLSVVELLFRQCRSHMSEEELKNAGRQLVSEFLAQYPVLQHDRVILTRLGWILYHCGELPQATSIVDSLRLESPGLKYTARTHDSASLELLVLIRRALREPLSNFIHEVLQDRPSFHLDQRFCRALKLSLKAANEPLSILEDVARHNAQVSQDIDQQIADIKLYI